MNFHEELQNNFQLLQQADLWLNGKKYMIPVGDVCIAATANGFIDSDIPFMPLSSATSTTSSNESSQPEITEVK